MRLPKSGVVSVGMPMTTAALVLAILLAAGIMAGSAYAQTAAPKGALGEAQVLALQRQFIDSGIVGNLPALSALVADNATFIHGSGLMQTKAQFIDSITSGEMNLTSYKVKESKVVFFKDGAVVLALVDVTLAPPRKAAPGTPPRMLHMRVSTVWLRKLDGWQIILNQGTPLVVH
jgi:Domain of unknown function (DUF4440)